jgi:pSer/pThr/pTyr-binding forkhead associated (FHA) protein
MAPSDEPFGGKLVATYLVITTGSFAGKEYPLPDGRVWLVGRAEDCDLRVPNSLEYRTVSRHHCLLDIDLPRVRVRDLRSRNGTFINGRRVWPAAVPTVPAEGPAPADPCLALTDGDLLKLGGVVFRVVIPPPVSPETRAADRENPAVYAPSGPEVNRIRESFHAPLFA